MNMRLILVSLCLAGLWAAPACCQAQKPQLVVQIGHSGAVSSLAFSPDGKTVASCAGISPYMYSVSQSDHTIKLWDVATGNLLRTLAGHKGLVFSLVFSPDKKTLVSSSVSPVDPRIDNHLPSEAIIFWDIATGKELHAITVTGPISYYGVCFSPDGKILVGSSQYQGIKMWEAATGKELRTFRLSNLGDSTAMTFSADGKTLAVWTDTVSKTVDIVDVATGTLSRTLTGDTQYLNAVAFSRDGKTAALGCDDKTIEILDIATGKKLRTLSGYTKDRFPIAFSPDGKTLASSSQDNTLELWDLATGKELRTRPGDAQQMSCIAFADDKTLAAGDRASTIKRWNVATGKELPTITGTTGQMSSVAFSPESRTLASASRNNHSQSFTLKFWDLADGHGLRIFSERVAPVFYISFSPDGRTLTTGNFGRPLTLWDIATGTAVRSLAYHVTFPSINAFSPDGRVLAHAGSDAFDLADSRLVFGGISLPSNPDNGVILLDIAHPRYDSIDRSYIFTVRHRLIGHAARVTSVSYSPDGKALASGDTSGTIKIWDVATGKEMHTLIGHTNVVNSVSYSPDGKTLASASDDDSVKLWDTATGQELASLYSAGDTDWTVVTPEGRFDTDNLDNIQNVHWVLPDQPLTPVPVEAFFAQYYTPGLLAHLLNRDPLPPLPNIATINHVQPQVAIGKIAPHPGGTPGLVDVTVSYSGQQADTIQPDGTNKAKTSGVYDLRLFRNGQLVAALPEDAAPGAAPTDLASGTVGKTLTHTFTVRLARDGAPSIPFTTYAFNSDKVKSQTASLDYTPTMPLPVVKGRAWVLAFGVNAYSDPHWNLHYAAADARAFGEQLVPRLQKTGQYSQVTFVPLVSDTGRSAPNTLPATKAALRAALMALAGKAPDAQGAPFMSALRTLGAGKAAPEDMVLLAFSCHGDSDTQTGEYYLFPADIGPDQSHGLTPDLKARSLSSAELTQWMQGVDAGEMAMVIDSCHSAAAAGQAFKPGPMDSPGLGQLAYYKRMRILSASQADESAKEYPDLGHGLLTSALVDYGLMQGQAKPESPQSLLTLGPWLSYAEGQVPRLDAREHGERLLGQKATVMVNGATKTPNAGLQKPSLFDFHRAGARDAAVSTSQ